MERKTIEENKNGARDYAVLVGLKSPVLGADSADEESLAELSALVETAGGQSVGMILQSREKPDPHSFIGEGKVEEVKRMVENSEATMVIFDNDLSPSQVRVLTELCGVQVLDRSGLILDIFAQRARTKEGCLQVELAQYQYLLPRRQLEIRVVTAFTAMRSYSGFMSVRSIFVRYPSQRSALACNAFSGLLSRLGRFCSPAVISFSEVKKEMATFTGYLEVWIRAV